MRRRLAMLLSATLLVASAAVLVPASPAAAGVGVCAGQGVATLSQGLLYPMSALVQAVTPGLPHPVHVVAPHQPVTTSFVFSIQIGACAYSNAPTVDTISAAGMVSGWCGLSSGTGVTNRGARFTWVSAGSIIVLTGGIIGVVHALPEPLDMTKDCNGNKGGGETEFIIVGAALIFDHCAVKQKTSTTVTVPGSLTTVNLLDPAGLLTLSSHTDWNWTVWAKACVPSPLL